MTRNWDLSARVQPIPVLELLKTVERLIENVERLIKDVERLIEDVKRLIDFSHAKSLWPLNRTCTYAKTLHGCVNVFTYFSRYVLEIVHLSFVNSEDIS